MEIVTKEDLNRFNQTLGKNKGEPFDPNKEIVDDTLKNIIEGETDIIDEGFPTIEFRVTDDLLTDLYFLQKKYQERGESKKFWGLNFLINMVKEIQYNKSNL